jgi:hypothetical protein
MGHSDLSVVDDTVSDDFRDLRHGGHGKQAMKQVILTLRESFAENRARSTHLPNTPINTPTHQKRR